MHENYFKFVAPIVQEVKDLLDAKGNPLADIFRDVMQKQMNVSFLVYFDTLKELVLRTRVAVLKLSTKQTHADTCNEMSQENTKMLKMQEHLSWFAVHLNFLEISVNFLKQEQHYYKLMPQQQRAIASLEETIFHFSSIRPILKMPTPTIIARDLLIN